MAPVRASAGTHRASVTYGRILVPLDGSVACEHCVGEACLLLRPRGVVDALVALEVPLGLPLETPLPDEEHLARETLARARAIGQSYGVRVRTRIVRTRAAGESIVSETVETGADAVLVPMQRGGRLDSVSEFVLRHAPCRVLVAAL